MKLRTDVTRELEKLRDTGAIGAPLDAKVDVYCTPQEYPRFAALGPELRFLLITSHAHVHEVEGAPPGAVPAANTGSAGVWIARRPDHGREVRALLAPPCRCGRWMRAIRSCARAASATSKDPGK